MNQDDRLPSLARDFIANRVASHPNLPQRNFDPHPVGGLRSSMHPYSPEGKVSGGSPSSRARTPNGLRARVSSRYTKAS